MKHRTSSCECGTPHKSGNKKTLVLASTATSSWLFGIPNSLHVILPLFCHVGEFEVDDFLGLSWAFLTIISHTNLKEMQETKITSCQYLKQV